jgi:leucine dehydrogenase
MDLGTTTEDMLIIGEETEYVHGVDREKRRAVDPGPFTARGVFASVRATLRRVFGSDQMAGRVIHVQGVGDVGAPLARMLNSAGAKLILTDLETRRAEQLADELGNAETFEPHTAYQVPCDIYAPCAVGGTLNAETIPSLKCRIVCGSANNQLDEPEDAVRLHTRGILYAPDFVVNAGGAAAFALIGQGESDPDRIGARVDKIGESLDTILDDARTSNQSPVVAARELVRRRIGLDGT